MNLVDRSEAQKSSSANNRDVSSLGGFSNSTLQQSLYFATSLNVVILRSGCISAFAIY